MPNVTILEVNGIEKSFGPIKVLKGVNFSVRKGEVHALVGENGAGKSTLMNIIGGIHRADSGEIFIEGKRVEIKNPLDAQKLGIAFVHQEIALCHSVTVAENIFMSAINSSKNLVVNYKKLYKDAADILKQLAPIPPDKKVEELSIPDQQIIEIAKALSMNCNIIIFDEPTASLSENESTVLFGIISKLRKRGIGIIYISHRINEIFSQAHSSDRISVLRDGCYIGTYNVSESDQKMVINKMVGREIGSMYPPKKSNKEGLGTLLEVRNLSDGKRFKNINFKLQQGEILGISGLVGAGRSEIAQAVCGLRDKQSGEVFYKGKNINIKSSWDSVKKGILYLPEDRKVDGLFLLLSIKQNISVMVLDNISKMGFVKKKTEIECTQRMVDALKIICRSINQNVSSLSGGNQQKILFAKLLNVKPNIMFIDEPTRGIDVGAKSEIHKLLRNLADEGVGIIMISSELPEVIGMCDRVLVIHEGNLSGEVTGSEISETRIIHLASDIKE